MSVLSVSLNSPSIQGFWTNWHNWHVSLRASGRLSEGRERYSAARDYQGLTIALREPDWNRLGTRYEPPTNRFWERKQRLTN